MIKKSKKSINRLHLKSEECHCALRTEPDLLASAGCPDDLASVATLPDQWLPRHSGPILANYLRDREQNHNKILQNLADAASEVNKKIDSKIRALAELLLEHIQQNERDFDCVVETADSGEGPLSAETRNDALKRVNLLYNKRVEEMAAFERDALTVERERADGLRTVMRDHFQQLIAVGHKIPKDLLHDFDDRMYEVNQQLLSNSRAYNELEAQLRAQADESVIQARSALNQLCLGVTMAYRRRSAHPRTPEDRRTVKRSVSASEKKRESSDPSLSRLLCNVDEIDACVARLVDAYRKAVLKVFFGFSGKLNDLHNNLTRCNLETDKHECEASELIEMIERALRRLSTSVHKQLPSTRDVLELTHADKVNMKSSLGSLGDRLRDTYIILHDAGHLWDAHMLRSALVQKLTMAAVEDLLVNNDAIQLANEVNFNIALEQMRVISSIDKLDNQYDIIIKMLDHTAEMYRQHSEAELGRLEEFMNLPPIMAHTLLAEFNCFLETHPRTVMKSTTSLNESEMDGIKSPLMPEAQRRSLLPRAILQTELQELALLNWRNGFLEAFESNASVVPEELTRQARQWVDEKSSALHMRYSMKMVSHSIRKERVKEARDARLAELQHHESRLESHLDAIYDLIDRLPEEASQFLSLEHRQLYPICEWVDKVQADLNILLSNPDATPEMKKLKMSSYAPRLSKYRHLFENSLDVAIQEFKNTVDHRIQEGRVSNVRFMSQISLFSENGRYSAGEANVVSAAIMKGAEALDNCLNRTLDALSHRRAQLLALADQYLLPVQKVVEEFIKTKPGKAVDKKRSQVVGKKK